MRPLDQLRTIQSDLPAIDALTLMGQEDVLPEEAFESHRLRQQ